MYHCGPTVYDYAHIGNLRAFVLADLLRRVFEYNSFRVKQVMNITDVDDKTITRAREEHTTLKELTSRYENTFLADLEILNILYPHTISRATEHINEMVALIKKLIQKENAYKGDDGSIYFDISSLKNYGVLANLKLQHAKHVKKSNYIIQDEYSKEDARDFVLWKSRQAGDGDVYWETELGKGRPGWHIECSAMSMKYLGEEFDIHTGGEDLVFPHHTNEMAQSEAATGKPLAHFWLHNAFITVDNKKMAKSEGNIIILKNIEKKCINPLAYRYWLLSGHYRTLVNFTWEALQGAENALRKVYEKYRDFGEISSETNKEYTRKFLELVNNDLDTPRAVALLWKLIKDPMVEDGCKKATMINFDKVLGLGLEKQHINTISTEILKLVSNREKAREEKDWKKADTIRKELEKKGYRLSDTSKGTKINPI